MEPLVWRDQTVAPPHPKRPRRVAKFYSHHDTWREFPKQAQAFDYVDASEEALRLWATELESGGKRRYIVASYEKFAKEYEGGYFYELIREGSQCRAYFDIEGKQAKDLCEEFLRSVAVSLSRNPSKVALEAECRDLGHFDIQPDLLYRHYYNKEVVEDISLISTLQKYPSTINDIPEVFELDATTPTKFSRHAIFPTVVFEDSTHLGRYVNSFLSEHPKFAGIVDVSVYTKNRLFRLAHSSKRNKNNPFKPVVASEDGSLLPEKSLVVPLVLEDSPRIFDQPASLLRRVTPSKRITFTPQTPEDSSTSDELTEFVLSCRPGAYVRKRERVSVTKVAFHLAGNNRYCENINRHHKSNNVIMVADLANNVVRQTCHDPDCRNFVGFPIDIRIKK